MVIVYLFRLLIIMALAIVFYTIIKYFRNPGRHLLIAKNEGRFFFLDDPHNSQRNFQIVYKRCAFEGEKYLGMAENSFEVVNINLSVQNPMELKGLTKNDLHFIEKEVLLRYPYATIGWNYPIDQLLIRST